MKAGSLSSAFCEEGTSGKSCFLSFLLNVNDKLEGICFASSALIKSSFIYFILMSGLVCCLGNDSYGSATMVKVTLLQMGLESCSV